MKKEIHPIVFWLIMVLAIVVATGVVVAVYPELLGDLCWLAEDIGCGGI